MDARIFAFRSVRSVCRCGRCVGAVGVSVLPACVGAVGVSVRSVLPACVGVAGVSVRSVCRYGRCGQDVGTVGVSVKFRKN